MKVYEYNIKMKNYLVLYNPGLCGTWLTWLISQHKNFPQYNHKVKEYINDKKETKLLDWKCFGADWYTYKHMPKDDYWLKHEHSDITANAEWVSKIQKLGFPTNVTSWTFEENRCIRCEGEINNESFTKDCVKTLPNHDCGNNTDVLNTVDKELLKNIVDDMQPEKIIIPVVNSSNDNFMRDIILKRWIIWKREQNLVPNCEIEYWRKRWIKWSDWVIQDNPYGNNVHYVDIEKLTFGDDDEYLKLCEAIDETPIDKIQEEITSYRNILSEVAEHYDRIDKKI